LSNRCSLVHLEKHSIANITIAGKHESDGLTSCEPVVQTTVPAPSDMSIPTELDPAGVHDSTCPPTTAATATATTIVVVVQTPDPRRAKDFY